MYVLDGPWKPGGKPGLHVTGRSGDVCRLPILAQLEDRHGLLQFLCHRVKALRRGDNLLDLRAHLFGGCTHLLGRRAVLPRDRADQLNGVYDPARAPSHLLRCGGVLLRRRIHAGKWDQRRWTTSLCASAGIAATNSERCARPRRPTRTTTSSRSLLASSCRATTSTEHAPVPLALGRGDAGGARKRRNIEFVRRLR